MLNNIVEPESGVIMRNNIVESESGVIMRNNIVDNIEQCGQQNIVQSCFIKPVQADHFLPCTSQCGKFVSPNKTIRCTVLILSIYTNKFLDLKSQVHNFQAFWPGLQKGRWIVADKTLSIRLQTVNDGHSCPEYLTSKQVLNKLLHCIKLYYFSRQLVV